MSRMFALALLLALGLGNLASAIEPVMGYGYGNELQPSGLRFSGPPTTVRTASMENFGAYAGIGASNYSDLWGGSCGSCGTGVCMHWKYLPWTASWVDHGGGYGCGAGHGCRKCGGNCW